MSITEALDELNLCSLELSVRLYDNWDYDIQRRMDAIELAISVLREKESEEKDE